MFKILSSFFAICFLGCAQTQPSSEFSNLSKEIWLKEVATLQKNDKREKVVCEKWGKKLESPNPKTRLKALGEVKYLSVPGYRKLFEMFLKPLPGDLTANELYSIIITSADTCKIHIRSWEAYKQYLESDASKQSKINLAKKNLLLTLQPGASLLDILFAVQYLRVVHADNARLARQVEVISLEAMQFKAQINQAGGVSQPGDFPAELYTYVKEARKSEEFRTRLIALL